MRHCINFANTKCVGLLTFGFVLLAILTGCSSSSNNGEPGADNTNPIYPRFAYVVSLNVNAVSVYAVDNDSGRFR